MKKEKIDKLKTIMAKTFNIPFELIPDDANLRWFDKWTSLNHVRFLLTVEDEYELPIITEETIGKLTSIEAIANYIEKLEFNKNNEL